MLVNEAAVYPRDALCVGADPELWFPVDEDVADSPRVAAAKGICALCPVRAQCLEVGMREDVGIFGGLTSAERRSLARRAARVRRAVA
jgi:WhiB family redox-sensing transcriptional regulator